MQFQRLINLHDWHDILARHCPDMLPRPKPGFMTNWLGVVTDITLYAGRVDYHMLSERIFSQLPVPNDAHHVDADEYGGLLMAIENRADSDRLVVVEAGAAWGPWISAAGVVAKRMGISNIDLIGVEAEEQKFHFMEQHLKNNNLTADKLIKITLICGAAWTDNIKIYFGAHEAVTDYAGMATSVPNTNDHRGSGVKFAETQGYTLEEIVGDRQSVDYLAMDIQGSEFDVLNNSIVLLNERVRFLSVGTHSPAIHGKLVELFFKNGWHILWDKYPAYTYDQTKPDLAAMTVIDGELILVNGKLVKHLTN